MASTDKTGILGLSKWRATDKPKRLDFYNDNEIIDSALGGHINNANLHLDSIKLAKINQPMEMKIVSGTGGNSRSNVMSFVPSAVVVFAVGKAPVEVSGANVKVYSAFAAQGQCSSGVLLDGDEVRLYQGTSGSIINSMNESGVAYVILAFR